MKDETGKTEILDELESLLNMLNHFEEMIIGRKFTGLSISEKEHVFKKAYTHFNNIKKLVDDLKEIDTISTKDNLDSPGMVNITIDTVEIRY